MGDGVLAGPPQSIQGAHTPHQGLTSCLSLRVFQNVWMPDEAARTGRCLYPEIPQSLSFLLESEKLVAQSCLTLCDPMDCSPPGSSVHGILQARILEWVTMPSSGGSSRPRDQTQVSALQADSSPSGPPGKPCSQVKPRIFLKC